jgi:hypothetical protein
MIDQTMGKEDVLDQLPRAGIFLHFQERRKKKETGTVSGYS